MTDKTELSGEVLEGHGWEYKGTFPYVKDDLQGSEGRYVAFHHPKYAVVWTITCREGCWILHRNMCGLKRVFTYEDIHKIMHQGMHDYTLRPLPRRPRPFSRTSTPAGVRDWTRDFMGCIPELHHEDELYKLYNNEAIFCATIQRGGNIADAFILMAEQLKVYRDLANKRAALSPIFTGKQDDKPKT